MHQRTAQQAAPLLASRHLPKPPLPQRAGTHLLQHLVCPDDLRVAKILMAIDADAGVETGQNHFQTGHLIHVLTLKVMGHHP